MIVDLHDDKYILYFFATVVSIAVIIGSFLMFSIIELQQQHQTIDDQQSIDIHLILQNQKMLKEDNVILKQMLPLLTNLSKP